MFECKRGSAPDRLLTVSEADLLGLRVATIRAWTLRRKIGYSKLGRSVRIPESEIDRLVKAGFVPPVPERN